jgi:hypothetical protein
MMTTRLNLKSLLKVDLQLVQMIKIKQETSIYSMVVVVDTVPLLPVSLLPVILNIVNHADKAVVVGEVETVEAGEVEAVIITGEMEAVVMGGEMEVVGGKMEIILVIKLAMVLDLVASFQSVTSLNATVSKSIQILET